MRRLVPVAIVVMLGGGFLALQERNHRAGRFKVRTRDGNRERLAYQTDTGNTGSEPIAAILDIGLGVWAADGLADAFPVLSTVNPYPRPDSEEHPRFLAIPPAERLGESAARWARSLGARRVFLLEEMFDDRSSLVADAFRKRAEAHGIEKVGEIRFHQPYGSLAEEVLRTKPDAVFMAGEPRPHAKTREIFRLLREAGFAGELLFADSDPDGSLVVLQPVTFPEGSRLVSLLAPPPAEFSGRFGHTPPGTWYGYLAARAAIDAIEKSESKDPAAIRRALASFSAPGVLGGYTFKGVAWTFTELLK